MPLQTFTPNPGPAPGTKRTITPRVLVAEFGDGYSQRGGDGLNPMKQQWDSLNWQNLTRAEADAIDAFFALHAGWQAFYWTPPGESAALKFVCPSWAKIYVDHDIYNLEASFTEVKDLSA